MKAGMLYPSLAVVGGVVVPPGGKTPQMNQCPLIPTWTWCCSECADVLCALVSAPAQGEAPPGKRDDSGAGPGAHRALALGPSWHGHLPLGHHFGNVLFPSFSLPALSSFCACPQGSNPSTGLLSPETQIVGMSVRSNLSSLTPSSPTTSSQT